MPNTINGSSLIFCWWWRRGNNLICGTGVGGTGGVGTNGQELQIRNDNSGGGGGGSNNNGVVDWRIWYSNNKI